MASPRGIPDSYIELVEEIGAAAAAIVVAKRGGTSIYVPATYRADHTLCADLGEDVARALIAAGPGRRSIPSCRIASRRAMIRELAARGWRHGRIALHVGVTEGRVYQILAEDPVDARQMDLFDLPD